MALTRTYTFPSNPLIKRYDDGDFASDTNDKICTYVQEPIAVLFYDETADGVNMLSIFSQASQYVNKIKLGVCHLGLETEAIEIFNFIKKMPDHPYHWVTLRKFPLLLVYRHGFPMAFYDGPPDASIMSEFLNKVAPNPNFHNRNITYLEQLRTEMWKWWSPPNTSDVELPAIPYREE